MEGSAGPGGVRPRDLLPAGLALAAAIVSAVVVGDESAWTIWLLFAPVAVALLPLAAGAARRVALIVAAVLLVCWCVAALFSVGVFYVPAAAAMVWAAVAARG
jgi:hypothetical protein